MALQTTDGKIYWTRAEDRLRELIKDRVSKQDAAVALGRSLDAVTTRWNRLSNGGSPKVDITRSRK